jgi:hypothetical protein
MNQEIFMGQPFYLQFLFKWIAYLVAYYKHEKSFQIFHPHPSIPIKLAKKNKQNSKAYVCMWISRRLITYFQERNIRKVYMNPIERKL